MSSFGVTELTNILERKGFRIDRKTRRILDPFAISLYGCTASTSASPALIVNPTEKARVRRNFQGQEGQVGWLMRLDRCATTKGLHSTRKPDSVWVFPVKLPVDDEVFRPGESKKAPDGFSVMLEDLSPETVRKHYASLVTTAQEQQSEQPEEPEPSTLERECDTWFANMSESPTEIQQLVWMRTSAGQIFRTRVRKAYADSCAFCGFTIVHALEAAHILPWARADNAARISVNNGILLCRNCHSLFDANAITLTQAGEIECRLAHSNHSDDPWRNGHQMALPCNEKDCPRIDYIKQRYLT